MFQNSAFRQDALNMESIKDKTEDWKKTRNEKYIREAGWHFKTLAVQEVGAYKLVMGLGSKNQVLISQFWVAKFWLLG